MNILVVDDELFLQEMMEAFLIELGHTVTVCGNGTDAISYYKKHSEEIDLSVLDIVLPDMDGFAIFGAIREERPDARILMCSGYSTFEGRSELVDDKRCSFLAKPFGLEGLSEEIDKLLKSE